MNPYLILGAVLFWVASVGSAGWFGMGVGEDRIISEQAKVNKAIDETRAAAQQGAADAISQIKVVNTTVKGRVETIVRENTRYIDCKNTAEVMRNINESLTGESPRDDSAPKQSERGLRVAAPTRQP